MPFANDDGEADMEEDEDDDDDEEKEEDGEAVGMGPGKAMVSCGGSGTNAPFGAAPSFGGSEEEGLIMFDLMESDGVVAASMSEEDDKVVEVDEHDEEEADLDNEGVSSSESQSLRF